MRDLGAVIAALFLIAVSLGGWWWQQRRGDDDWPRGGSAGRSACWTGGRGGAAECCGCCHEAAGCTLNVAVYILRKQGPMTAMKLQKLAYYAQAWSLVWDEQPLFPERIEAWANGPVIPDLYQQHRGRFEVAAEDFPAGDPSALTDAERETIDAVIGFYGPRSAHELSELTHREAPWRQTRLRAGLAPGARGTAVISQEDLFEYYDGLTSADTEA